MNKERVPPRASSNSDGGSRIFESPEQGFMTEKEAATFLGLSVRTLQGLRYRGGGPIFYKFGRSVRYLRSDLTSWATANRRHSTSDPGPLADPREEDSVADPADRRDADMDSTPADADLRSAT